mmetsp:Transcript_5140/g.13359  ORF Transcript_5140/g.13359 Transcript_5140/m.13359 type:complete len:310 (-) Transcript_5140:311-1240(-)
MEFSRGVGSGDNFPFVPNVPKHKAPGLSPLRLQLVVGTTAVLWPHEQEFVRHWTGPPIGETHHQILVRDLERHGAEMGRQWIRREIHRPSRDGLLDHLRDSLGRRLPTLCDLVVGPRPTFVELDRDEVERGDAVLSQQVRIHIPTRVRKVLVPRLPWQMIDPARKLRRARVEVRLCGCHGNNEAALFDKDGEAPHQVQHFNRKDIAMVRAIVVPFNVPVKPRKPLPPDVRARHLLPVPALQLAPPLLGGEPGVRVGGIPAAYRDEVRDGGATSHPDRRYLPRNAIEVFGARCRPCDQWLAPIGRCSEVD